MLLVWMVVVVMMSMMMMMMIEGRLLRTDGRCGWGRRRSRGAGGADVLEHIGNHLGFVRLLIVLLQLALQWLAEVKSHQLSALGLRSTQQLFGRLVQQVRVEVENGLQAVSAKVRLGRGHVLQAIIKRRHSNRLCVV